jgi:hypothetical protein
MAKNPKRKEQPRQAGMQPSTLDLREPLPWHVIGVLAFLVAIFFREILLGSAFLWEDFLYFSYPVRNFAATSVATGSMPLWNPYTFNGMPFLADIQTTVFYLPCMLLSLFTAGGRLTFYSLEFMVIAHYVLAGASMFYLARSFGLRNFPALFAAAAYMLSGFMIVHAIHQQIITMVAWYPLILLFFRNALTRKEWSWAFLTALVLGHSILAGYPQLSLYFYFFLFVYFLFELLTTYHGRELVSRAALMTMLKAGIIVALSVALAMIQLLPTYEMSSLSQRAQITYEKATEGTLAWSQLLTLYFPKLFGTAGANGYNYWGPGTYWYFWETCIYLGALPLLLTVLSAALLKRNKYVAFFWGYALFSLVFALGNNVFVHRLFYDFVPGFSTFRNPARMGIFLTFATSLLSGFALNHLFYGERNVRSNRQLLMLLGGTVGVGLLVWLLVLSGSIPGAIASLRNAQQALALVRKEAFVSLLVLVVSGILLFALIRGVGVRGVRFALIPVFLIDMLLFGGTQNTSPTDPKDYFGRTEGLLKFFKEEGQSEIFRINTRNSQGMIMDRNQGMIDRIFMMEGYTPLALQRTYAPLTSVDYMYDLLNVKYKTVTNEQAQTLSIARHATYFPRAFFLFQTYVVHSEAELIAYLKSPEFNHRTTAVLEKDPSFTLAPTQGEPQWSARITRYENNDIELDLSTDRDGLLVLSEIFYPGWKAYIDGKETEIFRTDYNLRGVFVPHGSHKGIVRFEPASYIHGLWITLVTLVICSAGLCIPLVRSQRTKMVQKAETQPAHS